VVYLVSFLLVIFLALFFSPPRGALRAGNIPVPSPVPSARRSLEVSKPMTSKFSREEVQKRLAEIGKTPPPSDLRAGAMCYRMAGPPDRAEYLCPSCGQRTLYVSDRKTWSPLTGLVARDLPACRRLVGEIQGLDISLDESEFCRKCSPALKSPGLILVVRYRDETGSHRFRGVTTDDLVLIREFTGGSDRHRSSNDAETPLKAHMDRLVKLLGTGK